MYKILIYAIYFIYLHINYQKIKYMIYLIEDRDYLKIGYTKNIVDRLTTFELHNCYAKLLIVKEGTLKDEEALHKLCKEYKYKRE